MVRQVNRRLRLRRKKRTNPLVSRCSRSNSSINTRASQTPRLRLNCKPKTISHGRLSIRILRVIVIRLQAAGAAPPRIGSGFGTTGYRSPYSSTYLNEASAHPYDWERPASDHVRRHNDPYLTYDSGSEDDSDDDDDDDVDDGDHDNSQLPPPGKVAKVFKCPTCSKLVRGKWFYERHDEAFG